MQEFDSIAQAVDAVRAQYPRTPAVWACGGEMIWRDPEAVRIPHSWQSVATVSVRSMNVPPPDASGTPKVEHQSIIARAVSLAKDAKSLAKTVLTTNRVDAETMEKRFAICRQCDKYEGDEATGHCGICGCRLMAGTNWRNKVMYEEIEDNGCPYPGGSKWAAAGLSK